jgi:16S rRNA (guanine527-N7)-methyltransferase
VEDHSIINRYFKNLDVAQQERFIALGALYADWNSRINLVSRQDIDHLYERHILHSLSIGKFIQLKNNSQVLDLGTGGGFPGIPLAILFPHVNFWLVDSIGKKIKVVEAVAHELGLANVKPLCIRAENLSGSFDFIVSRAVAPLPDIYRWAVKLVARKQFHSIPNGIICLKGGDLKEELLPFKNRVEVHEISHWFSEEFFKTKKLVYLPC